MTTSALFAQIDAAVQHRDRADPFAWIRDATHEHRRRHGCWAYPYQDGSILGAIAGVLAPASVLELGTALGYRHAGGPATARRSTPLNAIRSTSSLRAHLEGEQSAGVTTVHEGDFDAVLPRLGQTYDLVFFDGYEPPTGLLGALDRSLGVGSTLVTTNLDLGSGQFRSVLSNEPGWNTHFIQDLAISTRR